MALPPLADLLALLPDNDVGAIEAVNQRDITTALYNGILDNEDNLNLNFLRLTGGQMLGAIRLPDPPVNLLDACNKQYVDSVAGNAGFVQKGGDTMDGDLIASSDDAPTPRSYTPRIYTEQLISDTFTAVNPLLPDGSVNMAADYTPTNAKGLVTKEYADALTPDNTGNLRSDGSVDMDAGYTPQNPLSITTKEYVEDVIVNDSQVVLWNDGHILNPNSNASDLTINLPAGLVWTDFDEITVYYAISDPSMPFGEGRMRSNTIKTSMINYTGAAFESISLMFLYGDTDTTQNNYRIGELTRFTPNTAELVAEATITNNNLNQQVQVYEIVGRKRGKIDNVVINNVHRASFEMFANQIVTEGSGVELVVNSKRLDNAAFSHVDGTAEITILKSGWLKCTGTLGYATTVAGDNCRAVGRTIARINGINSAGTAVNGGYIRGLDSDQSSTSSSCPISFERFVNAGDTVSIFATLYKKDDGCTTTNFILAGENGTPTGFQQSNFSIELVEDGA